jgi:hypothetical protein
MAEKADARRIASTGIGALSTTDGLVLLDAAAGRDEALLVPIRLDTRVLAGKNADELLPLFRELVRTTARRAARDAGEDTGSLRDRVAGMPARKRLPALLDLVRTHAAALLGYSGPEDVEPDRPFGEVGFDSLSATGFRNKLTLVTGLKLPVSMIFDYPSPRVLAGHLLTELSPENENGESSESTEDTAGAADVVAGPAEATDDESIDAMSAAELIRMAMDGVDLDD